MSEEQLSALLAKLQEDAGLQEKLKGAADLDAAVAIAKDAGLDVSKADWIKYQARKVLEMSDEELAGFAGGYTINEEYDIMDSIKEIIEFHKRKYDGILEWMK